MMAEIQARAWPAMSSRKYLRLGWGEEEEGGGGEGRVQSLAAADGYATQCRLNTQPTSLAGSCHRYVVPLGTVPTHNFPTPPSTDTAARPESLGDVCACAVYLCAGWLGLG